MQFSPLSLILNLVVFLGMVSQLRRRSLFPQGKKIKKLLVLKLYMHDIVLGISI